jgi:hypothetical protein
MKKRFFHSDKFPDKIIFEVEPDKIEEGLHGTMLVEVSVVTFKAALVAYLRRDLISNIEQMTDDEFIVKIINEKSL